MVELESVVLVHQKTANSRVSSESYITIKSYNYKIQLFQTSPKVLYIEEIPIF